MTTKKTTIIPVREETDTEEFLGFMETEPLIRKDSSSRSTLSSISSKRSSSDSGQQQPVPKKKTLLEIDCEQTGNVFTVLEDYCNYQNEKKILIQNCYYLRSGLGSELFHLEEIVLEFFGTEIPKHCFANCVTLRRITINGDITTLGPYAFFGCKQLQELHLPDTIRIISNHCFTECTALMAFKFPAQIIYIDQGAFESCDNLQEVEVANCMGNVITFGSYCFSNCDNLDTVKIKGNIILQDNVFSYNKKIRNMEIFGRIVTMPYSISNCKIHRFVLDLLNTSQIVQDSIYQTTIDGLEISSIPVQFRKRDVALFANTTKINVLFTPSTSNIYVTGISTNVRSLQLELRYSEEIVSEVLKRIEEEEAKEVAKKRKFKK